MTARMRTFRSAVGVLMFGATCLALTACDTNDGRELRTPDVPYSPPTTTAAG